METQVKMELYGNGLYIPVQLWSVIENKYKDISLTLDTGAVDFNWFQLVLAITPSSWVARKLEGEKWQIYRIAM